MQLLPKSVLLGFVRSSYTQCCCYYSAALKSGSFSGKQETCAGIRSTTVSHNFDSAPLFLGRMQPFKLRTCRTPHTYVLCITQFRCRNAVCYILKHRCVSHTMLSCHMQHNTT